MTSFRRFRLGSSARADSRFSQDEVELFFEKNVMKWCSAKSPQRRLKPHAYAERGTNLRNTLNPIPSDFDCFISSRTCFRARLVPFVPFERPAPVQKPKPNVNVPNPLEKNVVTLDPRRVCRILWGHLPFYRSSAQL